VIGVGVEHVAEEHPHRPPFAIAFFSIAAYPYRLVVSARLLAAETAA
jgi:hypothetical protein